MQHSRRCDSWKRWLTLRKFCSEIPRLELKQICNFLLLLGRDLPANLPSRKHQYKLSKSTIRFKCSTEAEWSPLTPNYLMGDGNLPRQTGDSTSKISASALTKLLDTATETPLSLHLLPTTPRLLETRRVTHCPGPWHLSCSSYSTLGWRTSSSSQHNHHNKNNIQQKKFIHWGRLILLETILVY